MPATPSVRSLARALQLAPATVSDALRGTGRVHPTTAARVRAAADAAGYRPNSLAATVFSAIRRTRGKLLRGTLAVIDPFEAGFWPHGPFPRKLVDGARARAAEMGFSLEEFVAGSPAMPTKRLDSILRSRGIQAVMVLPSWKAPDLSGLDWPAYAGIHTDYVASRPALHSVCSDHYGSMMAVLDLLWGRGYRRAGLILQDGRDARIQHRHSGALQAFYQARGAPTVPVLITEGAPTAESLRPWLRDHQPDVVLSHFDDTPERIATAYPTHAPAPGFVLLNIIDHHHGRPCAALDLQPTLLGARAAELLVGQLLRGELGVPASPTRSTMLARWLEGPSVRPPTGDPAAEWRTP